MTKVSSKSLKKAADPDDGADPAAKPQLTRRDRVSERDTAPDRVTMTAQPPPAPGTRKQAVTEKLLHNGLTAAYREQ
jgi:hypothetical protein